MPGTLISHNSLTNTFLKMAFVPPRTSVHLTVSSISLMTLIPPSYATGMTAASSAVGLRPCVPANRPPVKSPSASGSSNSATTLRSILSSASTCMPLSSSKRRSSLLLTSIVVLNAPPDEVETTLVPSGLSHSVPFSRAG